MTLSRAATGAAPRTAAWLLRLAGGIAAYVELTKPRIVALLVFTAYCAMVAAAHGLPGWRLTAATVTGLAFSAGGAAAVNMWFDRDIDAVMSRTRHRPLPAGLVAPGLALCMGLALGAAGFMLLWRWANPLAAWLSLAGYLYYAVVYTMWLKRRTPQNIVIGGGAGAFPPLVGWAAVTGHLGVTAWALFAITFFWTPSHFWSLALYKEDDYAAAGVPMLPVVRGREATRRAMLAYATVLLPVSLVPWVAGAVPAAYAVVAALAGVWFWWGNFRLLRAKTDETTWARRTFVGSLVYLPVVYTALAVCAALAQP